LPDEIWHLRGIGKYNLAENAVKAMLAVHHERVELWEILDKEHAEELLDKIVDRHLSQIDEDVVRKIRYELAILTNASKKTVERDIPFYQKFSLILGEEDVAKKPCGEGVLKTCEILGYSPKETAYVGDSQVDILTARNAGVFSIAVLSGMGLKHLEKLKPDFIFKNILEMSKKV
jgi:HAD superfamily hydrolase (TIGR01549 family)